MAIINGTIVSSGAAITVEIPTVRIPELPAVDLPFDAGDKFPMFDASQNLTVWVGSGSLLSYLNGAGTTPITPVVSGSTVQITVTSAMSGTNTLNVPSLSGLTFELERRGAGKLLTTEYSILPSGGFTLTDTTDIIETGEIFFADLYQPQAPPAGTGTGSVPTVTPVSIFTGIAVVGSSTTLSTIHYNKLIHVSGSGVTVTLPAIAATPDSTIFAIESTSKSRIVTSSSQNIYYGGSSVSSLYLGISEFIWLLKGTDGWYVISVSQGLAAVGEQFFGYKQTINTLFLDGSLISRSSEPRLWAYVQTIGSSLIADSSWGTGLANPTDSSNIYYPNKGFFTTGDGSTTFRIPDFRNQFVRGLASSTGTDPQRNANTSGGVQADSFRAHRHSLPDIWNESGSGHLASGGTSDEGATADTLGLTGGVETRPMNVGLLPLIRT